MFLAGQLVHPAPEKSMWMRGSPPMVVSDQRVLIRPRGQVACRACQSMRKSVAA